MTLARLAPGGLLATTLLACSSGAASVPAESTSGTDSGSSADAASSIEDATASGETDSHPADAPAAGDAGDAGTLADAAGTDATADAPSSPPTHTPSGVPLPPGWTLVSRDQFGTGAGSTVTSNTDLHARYYEAQFYNRTSAGLVTIPNTVINGEQETYVHFETAIAWSTDHLTIQARGQSDGSITSGEMVSKYTARSFCTEAKYVIPSAMGSWPAFWFYGSTSASDKSEIDVEQPITPNQGTTSVSLYNHPSQSNVVIADPAFTTQYMTWTKASFDGHAMPHAYTACYDDAASSLTRYIDGALIYTATFKWNASLGGTGTGPDATTIVNLAVGGSWPGNVSNPSAFNANLDLYSIEYYAP
jgi:hypothetical protein